MKDWRLFDTKMKHKGGSRIALSGKSRNTIVLILFLFATIGSLLLIPGCAYFNTFWNAEKYYNQAEEIRMKALREQATTRSAEAMMDSAMVAPPEAQALYEKAIKKASKVLALYSDSKYVDDALFIIGMSYFRTGEYQKAIRKFDELSKSFPESPFLPKARFYRAYSYMLEGNYKTSEISFKSLMEGKQELKPDALFMVAEIAFSQKNYTKAEQYYTQFVNQHPDHPNCNKAYLRLAEIKYETEQYQQAVETLNKIGNPDKLYILFLSTMLKARVLSKLGQYEEALSILDELLKKTTVSARRSNIELLKADIYHSWGKYDQAEKLWNSIIEKYPKTEASSQAYFNLGELYQKRKQELEKAGEMYSKSVDEAPRSQLAKVALSRNRSISELRTIKETTTDSAGVEKQLKNYFKMAELYLLDLQLPDSALAIYQFIVDNYPSHPLNCKARYGLAWIHQNSYHQLETADSLYAILLDSCLTTDWAVKAVEYFKMRGTAIDSTKIRTVAYLFIKAEEFLYTYHWPDSALKYYQMVAMNYPNSAFRPKALLSIASILSETNPDSAANVYQLVNEEYASSKYGQEAAIKLGKAERKREERFARRPSQPPEEEIPEPTPQQQEQPENPVEELPRAPHPKERGRLIYPEQEYSSELEGKPLRLKILINSFGEVTEAELLGTSGNPIIDKAAVEAAEETKFDPLDLEITQYNTWFLYEIRITRPQRDEYERP